MLTSFIIKWGYLQLFSTNRVEGLGSFYIYYTGIDDSSFEEHPLMTYKQVTDRNVCVTLQTGMSVLRYRHYFTASSTSSSDKSASWKFKKDIKMNLNN
jgi:hypothetical protein